jgi:hypothetical protein
MTVAIAFPFVFFAGLAFLFAPHRPTQVGGIFLCIAGLMGTAAIGPGDDAILPAVGMGVVGLIIAMAIAAFTHGRQLFRPRENTTACPKCGRQNASSTLVCPRCDERLKST